MRLLVSTSSLHRVPSASRLFFLLSLSTCPPVYSPVLPQPCGSHGSILSRITVSRWPDPPSFEMQIPNIPTRSIRDLPQLPGLHRDGRLRQHGRDRRVSSGNQRGNSNGSGNVRILTVSPTTSSTDAFSEGSRSTTSSCINSWLSTSSRSSPIWSSSTWLSSSCVCTCLSGGSANSVIPPHYYWRQWIVVYVCGSLLTTCGA